MITHVWLLRLTPQLYCTLHLQQRMGTQHHQHLNMCRLRLPRPSCCCPSFVAQQEVGQELQRVIRASLQQSSNSSRSTSLRSVGSPGMDQAPFVQPATVGVVMACGTAVVSIRLLVYQAITRQNMCSHSYAISTGGRQRLCKHTVLTTVWLNTPLTHATNRAPSPC